MQGMLNIPTGDARAIAVASAIQKGDVEGLQHQLSLDPDLAKARIVDDRGVARTLLHVASDWPGHFPNGSRIVATLIAAGTDVNAGVLNSRSGADYGLLDLSHRRIRDLSELAFQTDRGH